MPACRRHYPGRFNGACSLVYLHCQRPSLCNSQVGSCSCSFGACSAFTHVTACTLAESPSDSLHRKLRQLRCLHCRFDCYRVERTGSRAGVAPAEVQRLSRRTVTPTMRTCPSGDPLMAHQILSQFVVCRGRCQLRNHKPMICVAHESFGDQGVGCFLGINSWRSATDDTSSGLSPVACLKRRTKLRRLMPRCRAGASSGKVL